MILICYDGSADSRTAIEHAAELFGKQQAVVLAVWQPFAQLMTRANVGYGMLPALPDPVEVDEGSLAVAKETAQEGASLAQQAGLEARALTCAQHSTTARAILAQAEELGASAIVMGSRGLTGMKSLLLGSVSHEVIQHADRTVVIVPSARVAASRAEAIRKDVTVPV